LALDRTSQNLTPVILRQHIPQMPYVCRDDEGRVVSLHSRLDALATEFLPDEAPEVLDFIGIKPREVADDNFNRLDAEFVRVLEDVIDVLITKRVINLTDLPQEAQDKLYARRTHRHASSLSKLNLLGDGTSSHPDESLERNLWLR
jgi:hypothetical protein